MLVLRLGVGFALIMLAFLFSLALLANPALCCAKLVDRNEHVFLAG